MASLDTQSGSLTSRAITRPEELTSDWGAVDLLTLPFDESRPYRVGFAHSDRCVALAQRLRYEVFNLELGEGLTSASVNGLDQDEFDGQMTHLVLVEKLSGALVGTYRIQTVRHAQRGLGLYSAREFALGGFEAYADKAIELGRACLAKDHRSFGAIVMLWQAIGAFMNFFDQQYLFGCSSITSTDPDDGWRAMQTIRREGYLHPSLFVKTTAPFSCGDPGREFDSGLGGAIPLPKLFKTYMRLGARVVSEPAIDREFGTVDFLILMDGHTVHLSKLDVLK